MSIEREFVPYQESLELKSIGFDEQCFSFYDREGKLYKSEGYYKRGDNVYEHEVIAPTFSQAFRWFRERHDLCSHVRMFDGEFTFEINEVEFVLQSKETHEEAELACLKKLIQIIKEKQ